MTSKHVITQNKPLVLKPVPERIFEHLMNLSLSGMAWKVRGSFSGNWDLVAENKDGTPEQFDLDIVQSVATDILVRMGYKAESIVWGTPAETKNKKR